MASLMFMLMFIGIGMFQMFITVPMIRRRVEPNLLYGFRTPKTLSSNEVWYKANTYAGRMMFASGAVQVFSSVVLKLVPAISGNFAVYSLTQGGVTLVSILVALWLSERYAASL